MNSLKLSGVKLVLSAFTIFLSTIAFAQDKKVDLDINVNKGNDQQWYMNPIAWIIGGAVFILLLVALLRGKGSRD